MKPILKIDAFIFLTALVIFQSCKKEKQPLVVVPSQQNNRAPFANAGTDQTITLPANTAKLDGSDSADPDNNIANYSWSKISGPTSFNITNVNAVKTQVTNLVHGIYHFELKVTDSTNLSVKDTVMVIVNMEGTCPQSGAIYIARGDACITSFGKLSQPGFAGAVTIGDKIFFGVTNGYNGVWNVYDTSANTWSTLPGNLNLGGPVVGYKMVTPLFNSAWAQTVDIYDALSNSSSTAQLKEPIGYSPINAVVGSKVFFAGDHNIDSNWTYVSKKLSIYDAASNSCSVINFNEARGSMAAVSFGNKIFFAGGWYRKFDSPVLYCDDDGTNCFYEPAIVGSNRVDIYDVSSGSWSVAQLSEGRGDITTAIVDNKIVFAGGGSSTRVDIYDASSDSWSTAQLSKSLNDPQLRKRAHTVGHKVIITGFWSNIVDIYDAETNSWSSKQMAYPNGTTDYSVASAGNKILFFNVFDKEDYQMHLDMYDASTNTWSTAELNRGLSRAGVIAAGNQVYIAGGIVGSIGNFGNDFLDDVWKFQFK